MVETKKCKKCGEVKNIEMFKSYNGRIRKDGTAKKMLRTECKDCTSKMCADWRARNPEYSKVASKEWRNRNNDRRIAYDKSYKEKNQARIKAWKKNWDINGGKLQRQLLSDSYAIALLKSRVGWPAKVIRQYPELIEIQKIITKTNRLCKTLQNSEKA